MGVDNLELETRVQPAAEVEDLLYKVCYGINKGVIAVGKLSAVVAYPILNAFAIYIHNVGNASEKDFAKSFFVVTQVVAGVVIRGYLRKPSNPRQIYTLEEMERSRMSISMN